MEIELIFEKSLLVLVVFCLARWNRVGRDPRPGVVIARYEAPRGESPAETRRTGSRVGPPAAR